MKIDSAYVTGLERCWHQRIAAGYPSSAKSKKKLAITGANLWPDSRRFYDVTQLIEPAYTELKSNSNRNDKEKEAWKLSAPAGRRAPLNSVLCKL